MLKMTHTQPTIAIVALNAFTFSLLICGLLRQAAEPTGACIYSSQLTVGLSGAHRELRRSNCNKHNIIVYTPPS